MKKVLTFVLCIMAIVCICGLLSVNAEEQEPELTIAGCNLSFENAIYIKYAVKSDDLSGIQLLIWTGPQMEYVYGTQNNVLNSIGTETVAGSPCVIFRYDKLAAKQMVDVIYARAYVERDGNAYYSDVKKYSVLQYAYNKTGRTGTPTTSQSLITLLESMLEYGANAQLHFNYKTDRLVNAGYYQISVVGGKLDDGCTSGLYLVGENVTLTAPAVNANGDAFSYWKDEHELNAGTTAVLTVTMVSINKKYTAVYGVEAPEPPAYSIGLDYSSNGDGTCTITGIGYCTDTDIVIPPEIDGLVVTSIGARAFRVCTSLTSMTIPDSVTSLGSSAFYGCTDLTSIMIPDSVSSIGSSAFEECTGLTSITIPDSVTSIGYRAFTKCTSLTNITIPDSVTSISAEVFYNCTSLTNITISDSVMGIGDYAFCGCSSLTSITIPDSVTSVGDYAFKECSSLTSITIPDSVTYLGSFAFYNCSNILNASIGNGVTAIGLYTFNNCAKLSSITIGKSITSILNSTFNGCAALKTVYYNGTIENWCEIEFDNWDSNPCLYGASLYIGNELLTQAVIPDTFTSINEYAFYNCTSLNSVVIPNSITFVGYGAFRFCNPVVYYAGTMEQWNNITLSTDCGLSNPRTINNDGLVFTENGDGTCAISGIGICSDINIVLPSTIYGINVTSISSYAFYDCTSLTSITIPDSVVSIGSWAFGFCTSLTDIYYTGTVEQWNNIQKGSGWDTSTGNYTLHTIDD